MRSGHRLACVTGALTLVVAGALSACDSAVQQVTGPDLGEAADGLATALTSGDLTALAFDGSTPAEVTASYTAITEGMADLAPTVTVADVSEAGSTGTVDLTWSWPVGGRTWTYDAEATMTQADDEWQTQWAPAVVEPSLDDAVTLDLTTLPAARGDIMGANGLALVTERPVVRYGIDRSRVAAESAGASARALARLVGIEPAAYAKSVEAAGDKAFVQAIVYRQGEVPAEVGTTYESIPGASTYATELPLAPTKDFAAPILGSVGPVTADMIEKDPTAYAAGDEAGLSGLQARYDAQLRGTPGATVNAVGSDGKTRELFRAEATPGTPLVLTMDADLQTAAEGLLAGIGPASALVAVQPSTGNILAAANGPGNAGQNLATYGRFAPGSTFKSVSSLALLRAGLTPDTTVACTPTITVDGKSFKNYSDYPADGIGRIPLRTALANSCNTAFISEAPKLSDTGLFDAAVSLGLGLDHDLGFPAYFGSVTPPASETEAAADMIGQGTILASPMVMAAVIASVQQGSLVVPRMVDGVEVSAPDGAQPIAPAEAASLKSMLRGVVTDGSAGLLAGLPGGPVIAKTGTAEFGAAGEVQTHAWMIAAQGDLAVAVFVDVGASGSRTAGPIIEQFLRDAR